MKRVTINGKEIADKKFIELKKKISSLNIKPHLLVIQVGEKFESNLYIENKKIKALEVGVDFTHEKLDKNISFSEFKKIIISANNNKLITGIIVQLPLPPHLDSLKVIELIDPKKDVDGLHPISRGRLETDTAKITPPTAEAVNTILDTYEVNLQGKYAVVVGQGLVAGLPIAKVLRNRKATVTVCDINTKDIYQYTKKADILVTACGSKNLIKSDNIKEGAIVLNIGITREGSKIYGDIDYEGIKDKTSLITPTPNGIGPLTVFHLLENTYKCTK